MNVRLLSSCRVVTTALEVFFSGSGKRAGGFSGLRVAYVRQHNDRAKGNRGLNMWRRSPCAKNTRKKRYFDQFSLIIPTLITTELEGSKDNVRLISGHRLFRGMFDMAILDATIEHSGDQHARSVTRTNTLCLTIP